jgi:hypothetical protein
LCQYNACFSKLTIVYIRLFLHHSFMSILIFLSSTFLLNLCDSLNCYYSIQFSDSNNSQNVGRLNPDYQCNIFELPKSGNIENVYQKKRHRFFFDGVWKWMLGCTAIFLYNLWAVQLFCFHNLMVNCWKRYFNIH